MNAGVKRGGMRAGMCGAWAAYFNGVAGGVVGGGRIQLFLPFTFHSPPTTLPPFVPGVLLAAAARNQRRTLFKPKTILLAWYWWDGMRAFGGMARFCCCFALAYAVVGGHRIPANS